MEDDAPLWWDDASYARYQAWDGDEPMPRRTAQQVPFEALPMPDYPEPPF